MALSQADYLKSNLDPKLLALKQAKEKALQSLGQERQGYENDYTSGIDATNQERDKTLPTFQVKRNQADAVAAQRIQNLRNAMAADGSYRSGTTKSEEISIGNQAQSQIHDFDTQENDFLGGIASKIAELNRVKAQRLGDVDQRIGLANTQYAEQEAGERNKATADYNAYLEQLQQAARARSGGGGAKQPSATELKNQTTSAIYDWVNNAASQGMSQRDAMNYAYQNAAEYSQYGVNPQDVLKYIEQYYTQYRNPNRFAAGGYQPV